VFVDDAYSIKIRFSASPSYVSNVIAHNINIQHSIVNISILQIAHTSTSSVEFIQYKSATQGTMIVVLQLGQYSFAKSYGV